jgi:hypothetical protein
MTIKTLFLGGLAALSLAAPAIVHADPEGWRGQYGYSNQRGDHDGERGRGDYRGGWRGDDHWRGGDRREYGGRGRWERSDWGRYERRCWIEYRGYNEDIGLCGPPLHRQPSLPRRSARQRCRDAPSTRTGENATGAEFFLGDRDDSPQAEPPQVVWNLSCCRQAHVACSASLAHSSEFTRNLATSRLPQRSSGLSSK